MLITRNNSEFLVSVISNTNRVVSSSHDNFAGTKTGTYIKIGAEDLLYQIFSLNQFFYTVNFSCLDTRTIELKENSGINLQLNDSIKIFYDEYELGDVVSITKGGRLFSNDDILSVAGGELSIDIRDGIGHPTKLKVESVDDNGAILKLSALQRGRYITPPSSRPVFITKNGVNSDVELKFTKVSSKTIINRAIKTIRFKDDSTILGLDYCLPLGLKEGSISVEKYELFLTSPYLGKSTNGAPYYSFKDFTPVLNLPLLAKGSNCFELLHNQAILRLEQKIVELEKAIKKLTSS